MAYKYKKEPFFEKVVKNLWVGNILQKVKDGPIRKDSLYYK